MKNRKILGDCCEERSFTNSEQYCFSKKKVIPKIQLHFENFRSGYMRMMHSND